MGLGVRGGSGESKRITWLRLWIQILIQQTEWLKQQKCILSALEARSLRSSCWWGCTPSAGAMEGYVPGLSPRFWGSLGVFLAVSLRPPHVAFYLCASVSVFKCPLFHEDTSHWVKSCFPKTSSGYLCEDPNEVTFQALGIRIATSLGGKHN